MHLRDLVWDEERVEHIARHCVHPEEVREVCSSPSVVIERAPSRGPNPVYYFLGQTSEGRYLFCVLILFPDGNGLPITARDMTLKERRRYQRR
jgi:uncharacterized DUF497 family protein